MVSLRRFANGRDALQALLTDKHYDVVISDIIMPVMDGIELLKRIKGNPQINDVPVVMLTSKGETVDRLQGISSGADAYMEKPFSMEELHAVIDNLVDNVRRLKGKYSGTRDQVENIKRTPTTGNNEQLMDRVMQSVNNHLADPEYSVETLTADVGISRAQLHRKMKELTGISTAEFIRNIRMQRAAELIEEGKSISHRSLMTAVSTVSRISPPSSASILGSLPANMPLSTRLKQTETSMKQN